MKVTVKVLSITSLVAAAFWYAGSGDAGEPVALFPNKLSGKAFHNLAEAVRTAVETRNTELQPTKKVEITTR